jgi:PAS domain S-box-containing protein
MSKTKQKESGEFPESFSLRDELSHLLIEELKDYAVFTLGPDNRVATWNVGARRILGYEEAEIVGQPGSIIFTPEDRARGEDEKELATARAKGRAEDQRWHLRRDGTRFWANGVMTALGGEGGEVRGFVKVLRDETERRRLEEERDRLFMLSMDMLCIVTLDGCFKRVNPAFERTLGYSEAELLSTPILDLLHPDDRALTGGRFEEMAAGRPVRYMENRLRCKDGSYRWAAWSYFPVAEEGLAYGVGRDMTEQKQAAAEREELLERERAARADAEAANRLKDEFLATLSHELRNPLNSIVGYATVLLHGPEGGQNPAVRKAAEIIHRSALAQAQLISDLLDLSRLQTGKLAVNRRPIPLAPTVADAVEAVRADAAAKRLTLDVELAEEPLMVEADAVRVQQVVWNLLSNAVKFTPDGGRVTLSLAREGEEARLVVEDTGQGIDPGFLPHVFDMFRQADARTTRRHGGMGIGLALVRQLVELHGGSVEAESEGVGRGARITARLPLYRPELEAGRAAPSGGAGKLAGLRVLVVDDTPDAAEAVCLMLELEGAAATLATGGAEALRLAGAGDFDLIVSDISMPDMDGYELLQELRRQPRTAQTPAIALTGFGRSEDVERAQAAGFNSHLTKPVLLGELIKAARSLT